jgi:rubrerythrin
MKPELASVITQARRLEALSMSFYVKLAARFRSQKELHDFWMSMARHEAGHVGALELLAVMLEQAEIAVTLPGALESTRAATETVERIHAVSTDEISVTRAFELAVELESAELEDIVLDLIHALTDSSQRDQAEQMLLHDLSDLSLMIEKYAQDDDLLARADALVERHVDRRDSRRPASGGA